VATDPSLFESWCAARDRGDLVEARRLVAMLQELRAKPEREDPFTHLTPPRQPGTKARKARAGRRSMGHR
jgi:hypothetical protein